MCFLEGEEKEKKRREGGGGGKEWEGEGRKEGEGGRKPGIIPYTCRPPYFHIPVPGCSC